MRGLYAILDTVTLTRRQIAPVTFATAVLAARPAALQVRAKDLTAREVLALLRTVAPLCRNAGVPLVCNDRPDLAALGGCDFVHLGQGDPPVDLVRRLFPSLRLGVSTHTPEQLAHALVLKPAYVAYGPVFATSSKANADAVVGLEGLAAASRAARSAGVPLVAIGGITSRNARDVAELADAGAVIGAVVPEDPREIAACAVALHHALGGGAPIAVEARGGGAAP